MSHPEALILVVFPWSRPRRQRRAALAVSGKAGAPGVTFGSTFLSDIVSLPFSTNVVVNIASASAVGFGFSGPTEAHVVQEVKNSLEQARSSPEYLMSLFSGTVSSESPSPPPRRWFGSSHLCHVIFS